MLSEPRIWLVLADSVLVVHFLYVLFVIGGQMLVLGGWAFGWAWTRQLTFRLCHLVAIGFVVIESLLDIHCPLTVLENILRKQANITGYETSFLGYWLARFIFYSAPGWIFTMIYTSFAALVLLTWLAYPPQRKLP
jgi:Protein of Unknown function (DUF2784)